MSRIHRAPSETLVSVIIPAFNAESSIHRCLTSVLSQRLNEIEVIVVNDASTDGTMHIIEEIAEKDARLKAYHLQNNVGVHAARARGIDVAKGAYIGFVDSDDWIQPDMYLSMYNEAVSERVDIVICGAASQLDGRPGTPKVRFKHRAIINDSLLRRFCCLEFGSGVLWNKLYTSSLIRPFAQVTLERAVDAAEDYIVNLGCFASAKTVIKTPKMYYNYVEHPNSASHVGASAAKFCRILRAYVSSLEVYTESFSPADLDAIDNLYVRQLQFPAYRVQDSNNFDCYSDSLRLSMQRLAKIRPSAIYPLIHTFEDTSILSNLKNIMRKLKSRIMLCL